MIGQKINNYIIEKKLGEGGMGEVYLGYHDYLDKHVAIKLLHPYYSSNPEIRKRFINEAQDLSLLRHKNIVEVYDYIEQDDIICIIMEYVDGLNMEDYIDRLNGDIGNEDIQWLFTEILNGISYAHNCHIIHRDLKPSNFMISDNNEVKILDFGIAKRLSENNQKLTKTGSRLGTVLYMSPEQIKGQEVDKRTDIYSLGVLLFQLITGKCPYNQNESEYELSRKIIEESLPSVTLFNKKAHPNFDKIIRFATEKNVSFRINDCNQFTEIINNIFNPDFNELLGGLNVRSNTETSDKNTDEKELRFWNDIKDKESRSFFETYLELFPHGRFVNEANENLQIILEEEVWTKIQEEETEELLNDYIDQFPNGEYIKVAKIKLFNIQDEVEWRKACDKNSIEGYYTYLDNTDFRGEYIDESKKKIFTLTDELLGTQAIQSREKEKCEEYISEIGSEGKYYTVVERILNEINGFN